MPEIKQGGQVTKICGKITQIYAQDADDTHLKSVYLWIKSAHDETIEGFEDDSLSYLSIQEAIELAENLKEAALGTFRKYTFNHDLPITEDFLKAINSRRFTTANIVKHSFDDAPFLIRKKENSGEWDCYLTGSGELFRTITSTKELIEIYQSLSGKLPEIDEDYITKVKL